MNRATQGTYAPASTFKVISTSAAVKAGYNPNSTYACPSSYDVGGQAFKNYESHSYGSIDLARALSVSCDTVFYKLANEMWLKDGGLNPSGTPAEAMYTAARDFGLGKKTGIDIPEKPPGGLSAGNRRRLTTPNGRLLPPRDRGLSRGRWQIVPPCCSHTPRTSVPRETSSAQVMR